MSHPQVEVNIVPDEDYKYPIPQYATELSSGLDLYACNKEPIELNFGQRALIPSGIRMTIPPGHELQIRPRSGLALKNGITILNSPATIDSDYTGPIGLIVINLNYDPILPKPFIVEPGMKIAQGVIVPVVQAKFNVVKELTETKRGTGGFGSTGV